jgi:hypothetical protein
MSFDDDGGAGDDATGDVRRRLSVGFGMLSAVSLMQALLARLTAAISCFQHDLKTG